MDAREFGTKLGKALKKADTAPPSPPALKPSYAGESAPPQPKIQQSGTTDGKPPAKV